MGTQEGKSIYCQNLIVDFDELIPYPSLSLNLSTEDIVADGRTVGSFPVPGSSGHKSAFFLRGLTARNVGPVPGWRGVLPGPTAENAGHHCAGAVGGRADSAATVEHAAVAAAVPPAPDSPRRGPPPVGMLNLKTARCYGPPAPVLSRNGFPTQRQAPGTGSWY